MVPHIAAVVHESGVFVGRIQENGIPPELGRPAHHPQQHAPPKHHQLADTMSTKSWLNSTTAGAVFARRLKQREGAAEPFRLDSRLMESPSTVCHPAQLVHTLCYPPMPVHRQVRSSPRLKLSEKMSLNEPQHAGVSGLSLAADRILIFQNGVYFGVPSRTRRKISAI